MFGHRYMPIWFKPPIPNFSDAQAGIADTEHGCVYCGHSEPNSFPLDASDIDWEATTHRTTLPEHKAYDFRELEV